MQQCPICGSTGGKLEVEINETFAVVACRCGLKRLWPTPTAEQLDAFYGPDYYSYARYRGAVRQWLWNLMRDAVSGAALPVWARWLRRTLAALGRYQFDVIVPVRAGSRVLDFGCGHGDLLIYQKARGAEVVGVERDARAVESARRHGLGVVQDLGQVGAVGFTDVVLQHSLEHMPDPAQTLADLRRYLAPGGTMHLAVPNAQAVGLRAERADWPHVAFPGHWWFFDAARLSELLERYGLRVSSVSYYATWGTHVRYVRKALRDRDGNRAAAGVGAILRMLARPCARDFLRMTAVPR